MKLMNRKAKGKGVNTVIVDWSSRSMNLYVNKVSANARVVGRELRVFIKNLGKYTNKRFNNLEKLHLIG